MRKALSLILAVVMVALMIPFAAITSLAADGDVLYSMDFTEWGKKNANAVTAVGETLELPDGFVGTKQIATNRLSSVSEEGVYLGGEQQGIAMTSPVGVGTDRVIEIKWNTKEKVCVVRFGFSDEGVTPTADAIWTKNQIAIFTKGGPGYEAGKAFLESDKDNLATMVATSNKASGIADTSAGNSTRNLVMSTEVKDANGNLVNPEFARMRLFTALGTGMDFTTYIVVEDDIVKEIHLEGDGARFSFKPEVEVSAKGCLSIWHTNLGANTNMNVKSIKFVDNTKGTYKFPELAEETPANVLHSYNFADAETLADVPYDINIDETVDSKFELNNGALWQTLTNPATGNTTYAKTHIKVDREYFPDSQNFTVEAVVAGGATTRILFFSFGMNEDDSSSYGFVDGQSFKIRFESLTDADETNDKLTSDNGYAQSTTTYNNNQLFPASMLENWKNGSDMKIQMVVAGGWLVGTYVTIENETVLIVHANGCHKIPEGDMAILQHLKGSATEAVGIKSITILDKPVYSVDTNTYETTANHVVHSLENNQVDVYSVSDVELTKGDASLRVVESENGIRFSTSFTEEDLQTLVDLVDTGAIAKVEVGTLITTTPWATAAGAVTHEALDAIAGDKTAYVEVMATLYDWYAENTFAGTISALKDGREYQAVGFIRITDSMGHVIYIYSDANTATLAGVQA